MLKRTLLAATLFACALPSYTLAETEAERQACTNDAQTHCADEIPDRERVYACLVQNVAQLSPACKKIINETLPPARRKR
jgi:hypothetical protein